MNLEPLPIDAVLPKLHAALQNGHAILSAPPGSGKTTRGPLSLLEAPWLDGQTIVMLEPRRPAARMAATHMSQLLDQQPGGTVGYQVRFERRIGNSTRVQVLTEAILTRRLQSDPDLDGVGLLIFDEFHERSLQADLGLALALDVVDALRPDLRILIMSATLNTPAVSELLGGAPIIEGDGRTYPVELIHSDRAADRDPALSVATTIRKALQKHSGDLLAFLPGTAEIARTADRLQDLDNNGVDILPLHGNLRSADQDRALRPVPGSKRRVILATDIAETSVTIEGVGIVVDCGLARKPRFEPGSGLTRLITEPVSRASATQRAGRAGRLGPGVCYQLWPREQEQSRPEHRPAEILQADLTPLVLELAVWGTREPSDLKWIDPPPRAAWSQAVDLLRALNALDANGTITALGRRMVELPLHPRLATMLTTAPQGRPRQAAADLAALLSDRDPWLPTPGTSRPADLNGRLRALETHRQRGSTHGFDRRRLGVADRLANQYLRIAGGVGGSPASEAGALLALAYPDRIGQRRGDGRYLLSSGIGAELSPDDALVAEKYLVIADLDARGRDGRIRLALPVSEAALTRVMARRIATTNTVTWDPQREMVAAKRETRLGAIVLDSKPQSIPDPDQAANLLLQQIERRFEQVLSWTPKVKQLQARVSLLGRVEPDGDWPDISEQRLRDDLSHWLGPWIIDKHRLDQVRTLDLFAILLSTLDWGRQRRLEQQAPTELPTAAGNRRPVDYTQGDTPVLAAPLQEMFGQTETPSVCSGRVPVKLHLLSPARRPLQITQDLAGFWSGSYAEVRKEMRGRYPKHHWPEDPTKAQAVAGGVRRRRQ